MSLFLYIALFVLGGLIGCSCWSVFFSEDFRKKVDYHAVTLIGGVSLALATAVFLVTKKAVQGSANEAVFSDAAVVVFLTAICSFFVKIAIDNRNHIERQNSQILELGGYFNLLSSKSVQGGKLQNSDEVYEFLCDARERASSIIRMMKIREESPVEISNGNVEIEASYRTKPDLPRYKSNSKHLVQWYQGLLDWTAIDGHHAERIVLTADPKTDIGVYSRFIDEQMKKHSAAWTTYALDEPANGLIPYNLVIFDDQEMTITFDDPGCKADTTIWLNDAEIVSFFVRWFDANKRERATVL